MYSYITTTSGIYPNVMEEALLKVSMPRRTFEECFGIKKREKGLCADGATIKDVVFNNPATIVMWSDGDKTVVKCQPGDTYNPELGLAMCIVKKCCGNKGNYNDIFKKWMPKESVINLEK